MIESALGFVARFITFAGVLLTLGAVVFRMHVLRRAHVSTDTTQHAATRAANIALFAAFAILPASLVKLGVQTAAMKFPDDAWVSVAVTMVTQTDWGKTWLTQLLCALLLLPALMYAKRRSNASSVVAWMPATLLAIALALTPSTASHAMSAERFAAIALYVDIAHVFAASAWLGSLFVMYCSVRGRDAEAGDSAQYVMELLRVFSPLALGCGALIAVSGVISSLSHVQALSEFVTTQYGQTVIAKVASVMLVTLFGFRNFKYVTPTVATMGVQRMRRGMLFELVATVVVLIVTAILVVTPPPMNGMDMKMTSAVKRIPDSRG